MQPLQKFKYKIELLVKTEVALGKLKSKTSKKSKNLSWSFLVASLGLFVLFHYRYGAARAMKHLLNLSFFV